MSAVGRAIADLGARPARIRPDLVPARYLVWILVCWVLTLGTAALILIPGATDGIVADRAGTSGLIGLFTAPLGVRVLILVAGGVLAGVLVIGLRLRAAHLVARELGLVAAGGFPVLALAADRQWILAALALGLLVPAEVVAHRTDPSGRGTALVGLLAALTWSALLVAQFTTPDAGAGWTWIALFGFAAAFAAFGGYYGVARAAESRARWLRPLFRDEVPPLAVAGIVALVVVLTVLRLTVARELFPEPDPRLWSPLGAAPASWVHAALVAGLVVVIAARSVRRPLRRSRERRITAALAVAGNADLAAGVVVIVAGMLIAAATGELVAPGIPPLLVAALKFAGVVAIVVIALLPAFRGTAAPVARADHRRVPRAAHPPGSARAARAAAGRPNGLRRDARCRSPCSCSPSPSPGPSCPGCGGCSAPASSCASPRCRSSPCTPVGCCPPPGRTSGASCSSSASCSPSCSCCRSSPPTATGTRSDLLAASGGQLLALVVFLLALPSFLDDPQIVVLGLFWLSVAVIAALTVRTADDEETAAA